MEAGEVLLTWYSKQMLARFPRAEGGKIGLNEVRSLLLAILLTGLLLASAYAVSDEPRPQAAEAAVEVKGLEAIVMTLRESEMRFEVGYHGELVPVPSGRTLSDSMVIAKYVGDELQLWTYTESGDAIRLFAVVNGEGKYEQKAKPKSSHLDAAPDVWPMEGNNSRPSIPPLHEIVTKRRAEKAAVPAPEGAIGWWYRNCEGDLVFPPDPKMQPFDNVIWAFPDSGGFRLDHSGPDHNGCFARILPNGDVVFEDQDQGELYGGIGPCKWNMKDERGKVAFPRKVGVLPKDFCVPETTVYDDGMIGRSAPLPIVRREGK